MFCAKFGNIEIGTVVLEKKMKMWKVNGLISVEPTIEYADGEKNKT